jgi:hypothetical protein
MNKRYHELINFLSTLYITNIGEISDHELYCKFLTSKSINGRLKERLTFQLFIRQVLNFFKSTNKTYYIHYAYPKSYIFLFNNNDPANKTLENNPTKSLAYVKC